MNAVDIFKDAPKKPQAFDFEDTELGTEKIYSPHGALMNAAVVIPYINWLERELVKAIAAADAGKPNNGEEAK
jgi:hypothetical protein